MSSIGLTRGLRSPGATDTRAASGIAAWALAAIAASLFSGLLVGKAPLLVVGVAGVAVSAAAFSLSPSLMLLGVLLLRPSLDNSGTLIEIGGANLAGVLGAATLAGGGLALALRRPRLAARRTAAIFTAFIAWALLSLGWSFAAADGARAWVSLAVLLVVFALARWAVTDIRTFHRMLVIIVASSSVPILLGLYQRAAGITVVKEGFESISGTFVHPNGFAAFLVVVIVLAVVARFESRSVALRAWLLSGIGLALVCLVLTYSRAAWLGLMLLLALLAVMQYRRLISVAVVGLIVVAVAAPSSLGTVSNRFSDLSTTSASYGTNSLSWRVENWSRMFPYAKDRPLTGFGFGSYLPLTLEEFGRADENHFDLDNGGVPAHNDYLLMSVELGVPGALLWIATLVALAATMWRARFVPHIRPYAIAAFGIFVVLIINSAVENVQGDGPMLFVVMAVAGAIAGLAHRHREAAKRSLYPARL